MSCRSDLAKLIYDCTLTVSTYMRGRVVIQCVCVYQVLYTATIQFDVPISAHCHMINQSAEQALKLAIIMQYRPLARTANEESTVC